MPSTALPTPHAVARQLAVLGQQIRTRRKALKVSATAAAQAAGMSRVTLYRIEHGEPSVTMGAYMNALAALGLELGVLTPTETVQQQADRRGWIPARIRLEEYPQLKRLAWQVHGTDTLTPPEALSIYTRNSRHMDESAMEPHERELLEALRQALDESHV